MQEWLDALQAIIRSSGSDMVSDDAGEIGTSAGRDGGDGWPAKEGNLERAIANARANIFDI
jgi:hypothetical protein